MFAEVSWDDDDDAAMPAAEDDQALEALLERCEVQATAPGVAARPKRRADGQDRPAADCGGGRDCAPEQQRTSAPGERVELGFVAECSEPPRNEHFPSKVGGAPVWLHPSAPSVAKLSCGECGRPLRFVLQLYCPRAELPHAYHRSIALFCCGGKCLERAGARRAFRAFRCNLPESTPLYVGQDDGTYVYTGGNGAGGVGGEDAPARRALAEWRVEIGMEGDWRSAVARASEENSRHVAALLEADASLLADAAAEGDGGSGAEEEGGTDGEEVDEDGSRYHFQQRVAVEPEQVLRYSHAEAARPLWLGAHARPGAVPPCERCGAARWFEFQLLPQLLCHVDSSCELPTMPDGVTAGGPGAVGGLGANDADALDWGTVAVYTCSASCAADDEEGTSPYAEEFCWHQPF